MSYRANRLNTKSDTVLKTTLSSLPRTVLTMMTKPILVCILRTQGRREPQRGPEKHFR